MTRIPRRHAALGLLVLAAGCLSGPVDCTTGLPEYAVRVRLFDAGTQLQLKGSTSGAITEGSYSDSLVAIALDEEGLASQFGAGRGRPGRYTLTVEREGYLPFAQPDIRVRSGVCGVISTPVDVVLQPES